MCLELDLSGEPKRSARVGQVGKLVEQLGHGQEHLELAGVKVIDAIQRLDALVVTIGRSIVVQIERPLTLLWSASAEHTVRRCVSHLRRLGGSSFPCRSRTRRCGAVAFAHASASSIGRRLAGILSLGSSLPGTRYNEARLAGRLRVGEQQSSRAAAALPGCRRSLELGNGLEGGRHSAESACAAVCAVWCRVKAKSTTQGRVDIVGSACYICHCTGPGPYRTATATRAPESGAALKRS
jgi:hypothetical protein